MPEVNDVNQGSSPESALTEAIASSPEVTQEAQPAQEAQTPPAEQGVTQEQGVQEEARIPYSRFKEKVDEANWYKQQLEQTIQNRPQQQFQQPTQAPQELGNTPEEREFWRTQRQIAREEAEKVSREQLGQIRPVIDAGRMELAQMKVAQFRATHSDIKPNSPDEIQIAERIQAGYTPDDAYWAVMGPRGVRIAESQIKQRQQQQIAAKKAANVETGSIPSQAQQQPVPTKKSFRDDFMRNWEAEEARNK